VAYFAFHKGEGNPPFPPLHHIHSRPFYLHIGPLKQWRRNEFESGGIGPARKWGGGSPIRRKVLGKRFFGRAPQLFLGSTSTISRFGERFRDGQYIQFLLCCSSTHGAPAPSHL